MIMNNQKPSDRDRAINSDVDPGADPAVELEQKFKSKNPKPESQPKSEDRTTDFANRQIIIAHEQSGAVDADFS
ncbi:hypothetical protein ACL6C3_07090 [Capilliphycus salinus ALCB114379]|uniref:hypothetical protein n=1 Tax=Capilliphycus salinus TaxID=2768948 RepID=UPI0039A73CA9